MAVQVDKQHHRGPLVLESDRGLVESTGLFIDTALIRPGQACILISNPKGYTQKIQKGTQLGTAMRAKVVSIATEETETQGLSDPGSEEVTALVAGSTNGFHHYPATSSMEGVITDSQPNVSKVSSQERTQMQTEKLLQLLQQEEMDLPDNDKKKLYTLLAEQHEAFVLEEKERGETDLIQFHIDTDNAPPKKQLLC